MELEESKSPFAPVADRRLKIDEPPPVRIVTVADARLAAPAGVERELDAFYVELLRFMRVEPAESTPRTHPDPAPPSRPAASNIVYQAENFAVLFTIVEPPIQREDLRMLGIEVPSLADLEKQFIEREIEYAWQKGLAPGQESLVLLDPAGNWVQIFEIRVV